MASKEQVWLKRRVGMITASELGSITSAKGKIIDTNISYIRSKRWERKHGFAHPVSARAMDIGNEQEPMIAEWCRANVRKDIIYSKDLDEIPFWVAPDCPLGASPDAFTPDESVVFEFKTLVGATSIEFFDDCFTRADEKRAAVFKDHGEQILGQFLSNPKVQTIFLVKYIYQDDDVMEDVDSPLAPWRGFVFEFRRGEYVEQLKALRERVILIDAMISSFVYTNDLKSKDWEVKDGKLCEKEE